MGWSYGGDMTFEKLLQGVVIIVRADVYIK